MQRMNNKFCHLRFCKLAKVQDIFKSPQYSNFMGLNNLCLCFCSKLFLTLKHYLFYFFHSFFLPCNFYFLYSSISPFLAIFLSSMPKWLFLYNRKDQSHYDFGQHWSGVFGKLGLCTKGTVLWRGWKVQSELGVHRGLA